MIEGKDKVILFVDTPERAALMYQRMSKEDANSTIWAGSAEEAIDILTNYTERLEFVLLEHDLEKPNMYSGSNKSGMEIVRHLETVDPSFYNDCKFIVHTWNDKAGMTMCNRLKARGYNVSYRPFGE